MIVKEIEAKSILTKSQIYEYTLNAYVGCQHDCLYCYAKFMKRFTGHREPWGAFVDVKINAPEVLAREAKKKKKGRVWISGVCDAYQYLEKKYSLTGRCLEILVDNGWPITIQTKSPLVLRDMRYPEKGIGRRGRIYDNHRRREGEDNFRARRPCHRKENRSACRPSRGWNKNLCDGCADASRMPTRWPIF